MQGLFSRPNTHIGQNFLIDRNILAFILGRCDVRSHDILLEVGAGKGFLTEGLLGENPLLVYSSEIDRRFEPYLGSLRTRYPNLRMLWGDALKGGLPEQLEPPPNKMVANIPYHITTPLLWRVLELYAPAGLNYMLLMVQKEAAERICAPARSKDRYPLGITIQAMGKPRIVRKVPPEAFSPSPRVDSALLEVSIQKNRSLPRDRIWRTLVRAAFSQRRKTLLNNLAAFLPGMRREIADRMAQAGLSGTARGEELELEQWYSLYEILGPLLQAKKEPAGDRWLPPADPDE